jgi:hypothetical protein
VGGAGRFGNNLVDNAEIEQVARPDVHVLGREGDGALVLPEDGGAALGRDDRVEGVLEHQDDIAHGDAQRAAASALADDDGDDGDLDSGYLAQVIGDRLGNATLFGADAGVGPGSVDEGDDWKAEFLGRLHHPERLAVSLGVRLAEIPGDSLARAPALLMADKGGRPAFVKSEAGDDGRVVGEPAVAVHLGEILDQVGNVIEGVRTLRVAGDLHDLGGRQSGADSGPFVLDLLTERSDFIVFGGVFGDFEVGDLAPERQDILLELIKVFVFRHGRRKFIGLCR